MPELPEVQTIVDDLNRRVAGRKIVNVWTNWPRAIKLPSSFAAFQRRIVGAEVLKIERRGKYLKFVLSGDRLLLIHLKMTGHFLVGRWRVARGRAAPINPAAMGDGGSGSQKSLAKTAPNPHLHFIFYLDSGDMLGFCDLRKFGTLRVGTTTEILNLPEVKGLGIDALDKNFTAARLAAMLREEKRKIKPVLCDQTLIAGLGNIYSDEALWVAKIYPGQRADALSVVEAKNLWQAVRRVLKRGLKFCGTTSSDFRDLDGQSGGYWDKRYVYRRDGEPCPRCGAIIARLVINARSAHYCPKCQGKM